MIGLKHLIKRLTYDDEGVTVSEMAKHMRIGLACEPENFGPFVDAVITRAMYENPYAPSEHNRSDSLYGVALAAILADHDKDGMLFRELSEGRLMNVFDHLNEPRHYGAAITSFASYVGVNGCQLRNFLEKSHRFD